jgi:hypothetical protein
MEEIKEIENSMAKWLAHPLEFGVAPKVVRYLRTYQLTLIGDGDIDVHLVEYEMPGHTKSRGFVNPPLTWSFLGDTSALSDYELLVAYCGWAWMFPRIQAGTVVRNFASDGEEARYIAHKKAQGFSDITVTSSFKIGTSEIYEVNGLLAGKRTKSAGNTEAEAVFAADSPQFNLPAIYSFLGPQVIKSVK